MASEEAFDASDASPHEGDRLQVGGLTLEGMTRGAIETCLRVPELKLMFDVGRGPAQALRYDVALVTHGHADHLGGLPYLASQRGLMRKGPLRVHLPEIVVDPMKRIFAAWSEIEDFDVAALVDLRGCRPGDAIELHGGLSAKVFAAHHRVPAHGYLIERMTRRLKPEYQGRTREEIVALRAAGEELTCPMVSPLLFVSGDTKIEAFFSEPALLRARVFVHEVTSWDARRDVDETRQWGHTHVDEMIAVAERFEGEALVLVHRSARHSRAQAEGIVRDRFPSGVRERVHVFGH